MATIVIRTVAPNSAIIPWAGLPHPSPLSLSTSHWVGLKKASHSTKAKIQRMASAGHSFTTHVSRAMAELVAARSWLTVYRLPPLWAVLPARRWMG